GGALLLMVLAGVILFGFSGSHRRPAGDAPQAAPTTVDATPQPTETASDAAASESSSPAKPVGINFALEFRSRNQVTVGASTLDPNAPYTIELSFMAERPTYNNDAYLLRSG